MIVPVGVIASTDKKGNITPLYLHYKEMDFTIEKVLETKAQRFVSIHRISYKCYNFSLKEFFLEYDTRTSIWYIIEESK